MPSSRRTPASRPHAVRTTPHHTNGRPRRPCHVRRTAHHAHSLPFYILCTGASKEGWRIKIRICTDNDLSTYHISRSVPLDSLIDGVSLSENGWVSTFACLCLCVCMCVCVRCVCGVCVHVYTRINDMFILCGEHVRHDIWKLKQ